MMNGRRLKRLVLALCLVTLGALLTIGLWIAAYPDAGDPKNIKYVLWTHGLNKSMNLDDALGAMTGDVHRDKYVLGLSEAQLAGRFGYVRQISVDRYCYAEYSGYRGGTTTGEKAIFLRDSAWMVILKNGVAVDLVDCKA
jgi:hypothetical protein